MISDSLSIEKDMSVFFDWKKAKKKSTIAAQARGILYLVTIRLILLVGSTKVFLPVFITPFWKIIRREGSTVKVHTRLKITPLASTTPISIPILSLMNTSITSPTTVVAALLIMDGKARLIARLTASTGLFSPVFSWR